MHGILFGIERGSGRSRVVAVSIAISTALHLGLLALASRARSAGDYAPDLHEVAFMDITYRPEVAKVLPRAPIAGGGGPVMDAPTYAPAQAPNDAPALDLSARLKRDKSQAKIDIEGFELDRSGRLDVIRLGGEGSGRSTDEILSQPAVSLARGLDRSGTAGATRLRGHPGVRAPEAQLQIEHRPLARAPEAQLPEMTARELPQISAAPAAGSGYTVAGPISQRLITNRVRPRYPKWALDRRVSGSVVVKIWVAPNGLVKGSPTIEASSGYPDLDQVVISALRGWEFEPLGPGVKAEDQWGVITFRFTLS